MGRWDLEQLILCLWNPMKKAVIKIDARIHVESTWFLANIRTTTIHTHLATILLMPAINLMKTLMCISWPNPLVTFPRMHSGNTQQLS